MAFELESTTCIPRVTEHIKHNVLNRQVLGKIRNQIQYMGLIRLEPYWLGPRQGREFFYLSEDAIICSFLGNAAKVVTILAVTGIDEVYSVIQSNDQGDIIIAARCDSDTDIPFRCFVAIVDTIENSISAVMSIARKRVNDQPDYLQSEAEILKIDDLRSTAESWYDGLTFCTWNALGQDLNESKILSALSSLASNDIRISNLLIDDNWQVLGPIPAHNFGDSFNRGLAKLTANSAVAPDGLRSLTSKIRSLYPHVTEIGVWHALMGYWGGISPTGEIADAYNTVEVPSCLMGDIHANLTSIAADDLPRFYNDLYSYLADSGITFVKTDVQHMLSTFRSAEARRTLVPAYQSAWNKSHMHHFKGKAISCMSQVPEILFSSLLRSRNARVMARNSDDIYPEVSSSHAWHVWTNAHNALFTTHLNVLPDWDMFQTDHSYSLYHAAARCISGGPITITDVPGQHDMALLKQITALDTSGRSIALRPDTATVVGGFTDYTESSVLKIGTTTKAGFSLLGMWNVTEHNTQVLTPLSLFPRICDTGDEVIIYNYRTQQIVGRFETANLFGREGVRAANLVFTELKVRGWEILTACPLRTVQLATGHISLGILGLIDKMSGTAAIVHTPEVLTVHESSIKVGLELKAIGVLGLCLQTAPELVPSLEVKFKMESTDEQQATLHSMSIERAKIPCSYLVTNSQAWMLRIDLESEWRQRACFSPGCKTIGVEIEIKMRTTTAN